MSKSKIALNTLWYALSQNTRLSHQFINEYTLIHQELEVLEIIKQWLFIDDTTSLISGKKIQEIKVNIPNEMYAKDDFKKVKEWMNK